MYVKGIFSDSNNIFLLHESEDINKRKTKQNKTKQKANFQNFSWFQFCIYKLCMIMCIGIAP